MQRDQITQQRINHAEGILEEVVERLANAQACLSCIVGLGNEYKTITTLKEKIKGVRYSLERRRESNTCDIDETTVFLIEQQERKQAALKKKKKSAR